MAKTTTRKGKNGGKKTPKPRPEMLGTGSARKAADALKKRKQMLKRI